VTIALALLLLTAPGAGASDAPRVRVLLLPPQTTVAELAAAGFSPGAMSAGLGSVSPQQTYLDIGQGNRVFDSLYDTSLLPIRRECAAWESEVQRRAESAPADIAPFLLIRKAHQHEITMFWQGKVKVACAFGGSPGREGGSGGGNLFIGEASLARAERSRLSLRPQDLLIVIARPTGDDDLLPIGIAGRGFDGNLTSGSTRMNGYVLSTDVSPTILDRFGVEIPSEMSGQPITTEGSVDPAAVGALVERMEVISSRRGPVVGLNVAIWLAALALVALFGRGGLARPAVRVVALTVVYLPLVLLLAAALEPDQGAEQLLVLLLSPLMAGATLLALPGFRALGLASALTVLAYAVDVIAGSPLTSLSLLGPNPGLGVRFYGIGNELEALLAVLAIAGTGAALVGFAGKLSRRAIVVAFVAIGLLAAFVFAAGSFGADVGAAIVFPVGAAVAATVAAGRGRRSGLLVVAAAPLAVLALLALIDLLSGTDAHLTRSVLDAGGFGELADVAQRRLQLSVRSFGRPVLLVLLPVVLAAAALAYVWRDRLGVWLAGLPAMRAGLAGALAATLVGTLANDSGALILEIGAAYLLAFVGFAWAESGGESAKSTTAD
jgi:hypothetical protein